MKNLVLVIILLLPFSLLAQINKTDSEGMRQGLWKKQYPNGTLMYEGRFQDDKPTGEWKRYHKNGQVKAIIQYHKNSDSAFVQLFNPHGQKIASGNYVNEKKAGNWNYFSGNRKIAEEIFKKGKKHGISRRFYETGELLKQVEWQNGLQEGKYQVFYKNGKPYMQCKYSNNLRNGLCLIYFQNGRVELEAAYKNNLRHGDWNYYNKEGELLYTLKYEEGKLLNPKVRDSIDNRQMKNLEKARNSIPDPEKFIADPSEYMRKMNIYR